MQHGKLVPKNFSKFRTMGLIHTAAILSREIALFYHPRPRSEKFGSEARATSASRDKMAAV